VQVKASHWVLALFIVGLAMISEMGCKSVSQETNPEAFKILKQKSINPKTGLPRTLDPNLFSGKAKEAYQVAREIPEILAQVPCFCECEPFGHENLLDCFIDNHGAG
jgi:Protein of unknown function with PCYCGC motif